jgi:hypothetical protein
MSHFCDAGLACRRIRQTLMVDQKIFIFLSKDESRRWSKNFGHTGKITTFGSGTNVAFLSFE